MEKLKKSQDNMLKLLNAFLILSVFIGFIIGFFICFTIFNAHFDTPPASRDDFAPLYTQKHLLETDFSSILNMENVEFISSGSSKVVTLTSKKCNLIITFDNQLNVTSTREKDNSTPVIQAVALSFCIGLFCSFLLPVIVCGILLYILPKSIKENPEK